MASELPVNDRLSDALGFEQRAVALAGLLRGRAPDGVLGWGDPAGIVLSHVVARELGARSVRCSDHDGLVELDSPLPDGRGLVLVVTVLDAVERVRAMLALAEQHGREVAAVGALEVVGEGAAAELAAQGILLATPDGLVVSDG